MRSRIGVLFAVFLIAGCGQQQLYRGTQLLMGTTVEVISPYPEAPAIVFSEIRRIEKLLSKYDPQSEIAALNRKGRLRVSPETFYVLQRSREFWKESAGAFDITIAPLVDLWGFTRHSGRVPSEKEIQEALKYTGSDKIILDQRNNVVKFKISGVRLDLGAIAKGYAVDCAVKKLRAARVDSCLVNAGGQVYGLGKRFGRPWRVALQHPRKTGFAGYLNLVNQAVATSGDYEQFFICGKRRFSHIIDPKSGYPEQSGVISATVIAEDGLTADALATAVVVLGEERGAALARNFPGVKIRVIREK